MKTTNTNSAAPSVPLDSFIPPAGYLPIPTTHPLELGAWRMPNGARFVRLVDDSEATWERYCADIRTRPHALALLEIAREFVRLADAGVRPAVVLGQHREEGQWLENVHAARALLAKMGVRSNSGGETWGDYAKLTERIADEFGGLLIKAIGAGKYSEVLKLNQAEGARGVCHSHDFCDANEVMAEAFAIAIGRPINLQDARDRDLWNDGWNVWKARHKAHSKAKGGAR